MAATLFAQGVTFSYGRLTIVDDIDLTVAPGHRVGIVAPNGIGKSTLLKCLADILPLEKGSVRLAPPNATVGYLPQEPERRADETLLQFLARRTGVADANRDLDEATEELAAGVEGADSRYADALERWLNLGAADLDSRAEEVCADLGLPERTLTLPMTALSGGQAARASLAGIVLSRYDIFLLDEPTNDLDAAGLDRLERFVNDLRAGTVIVSHDRAFLERTITDVLEIDEHTRQAQFFSGGWLAYLDDRAVARRHAEEAFDEYRSRKSELEDRARTQRQWAADGVRKAKKDTSEKDKNIRSNRIERSEKLASKVRISEKALQRLDAVEKPWEGWDLHLEIATAPRSGDVVCRLDQAVMHRGDFVLGPIDLDIAWAERIAIVGPNGSGKTTLLDAILGRLPLDSGTRFFGPGVIVGELEQSRSRFLGDRPLVDGFTSESGLLPQEARSLLAKFGLSATHVQRRARSLSPGERTRAALALLMAKGVNCLVLDEPTNHLDLQAIEQLEQALQTYNGTLLLVTHDRRLRDAITIDREIVLDG
ncbi:MAG: ABC-F family ATP-binding cassette domain-containing protein [Acidimicrobiia bacterium]